MALESVIIARGKVVCTDYMMKSRVVSGKSVDYQQKATTDSKINEKEANPLGYLRFGKAP